MRLQRVAFPDGSSVIAGLTAADLRQRVFSTMITAPRDPSGQVAFARALEVITRSAIVLFTPVLAAYLWVKRERWVQC